MSRSMKLANTKIFAALDEYCAKRAQPLSNAASPRWIATQSAEKDFLKNATVESCFRFSPQRAIARLNHWGTRYIATTGFVNDAGPLGRLEHTVHSGQITTVLSELEPRPTSSPLEVKNIVEIGQRGSTGYGGHDPVFIASLFPSVRLFEDLNGFDEWRTFFDFALAETEASDVWFDSNLSSLLNEILNLDPQKIPFEVLCRSIFDVDPSSFFLALYRCLEAIFSYSTAMELKSRLGSSRSWQDVSKELENALDWRPREATSLEALLNLAVKDDLRRFLIAVSADVPDEEGSLVRSCSKHLYSLRNGCVHHRPARNFASSNNVDWNEVCCATALLVLHVYASVFTY